jgi:hypothetical protein
MKIAKIIAWIGFFAMSAILVVGFVVGDFARDGARLLENPWGWVSMVDLYVGFVLFSMWIVFREKSLMRSIVWVFFMMVLGFFTGALYTLVALYSSGGDWRYFWLGKRADEV